MVKGSVRKIRRAAISANVAAMCVAAAAIFFMANYLSYRHYRRYDWTGSKYFSLSDKTVKILEDLKKPVKVYVFYRPLTPIYDDIKELLNRYQYISKNIRVEYVDPEKDAARAELLMEKFKLPKRTNAELVVFTQADKNKYVYNKDIVEMDYSGMRFRRAPKIKAFKGEQAFTSAIVNLTEMEQPVVYSVSGHGEKDLDGTGRFGLEVAKTLLERENLKVEKLTLFEKKEVPGDCDLLMILGPRDSYTDEERKAIGAYLDGGGRLFVALDPQTSSGLESFLRKWDVALGNNIVVDPASAARLLFFSAINLYADNYMPHMITDEMKGRATLFTAARSVAPGTANPKLKAVSLVRTSSRGWGEINLEDETFRFDEGEDLKGPVSIGVAVEANAEKAGDKPLKNIRMVVMGDSEFLTNSQINNLGNASFFLNIVNWLTSREKLIAIGPKMPEQTRVRLNAAQMKQMFFLVWAGLPGLGVLLGLVVWWRRRK